MDLSKLGITPGPWDKCHANNDKCPCGLIWEKNGNFVIASVTSSCREHESSNLGEGLKRGSEEFIANARLIAAAPEMLEALIDRLIIKLNCAKDMGQDGKFMYQSDIRLIEKATGKTWAEIKELI